MPLFRFAAVLVAFVFVCLPPLCAQKKIGPEVESRLPVKVVGDRLVARVELKTRFRRIPVNLFVDYENPCGLEIHNGAARALRLDPEGKTKITVSLPGFDIEVARREHGDEDLLNDFTRLYSRELGETACVGTIGAAILGDYQVTFDLPGGFVILRPKSERSEGLPPQQAGAYLASLTVSNGLVWLPVTLADGRRLAMNIGTSRYDTIVDETICAAMEKPAGDIGSAVVSGLDLAPFVAFRPEELVVAHPDGALGSTGINLLECMTIEVDRVNRWARLSPRREPAFPEADLAFFRARLDEEVEPLEAFLKKYGETRLAREAAELLLNLRLDDESELADFETALVWMDKTRIEDLRATEALTTMKTLVELNRPDVAIRAGELGIKGGRKDRYPESVHKLHSRVGELCLDAKRSDEAWEHLLSAAFGLPSDGMVNLNLGRFYESEGRLRRAMSRYVQAVVAPESGPQAVAGLERVQEKLGGESLSVDLVDRLVSGKVFGFTAATKFEETEKTKTNRVVLTELFTNAHFGRPLREGWRSFAVGGAMAVEGLLSHFPRERLIVISHQIPVPEPVAIMNEVSEHHARLYGISSPTVMVTNGSRGGPGAQVWRKAEEVYEANRAIVMDELSRKSDYELELNAKLVDGRVSGQLIVKGPENDDLVAQVLLVERGVLYPGKAQVVVNRMVVRGELSGDEEGLFYEPRDDRMEIDFSRKISEIVARNREYLEAREKDGAASATRLSLEIDPRQVAVVAFVRDTSTNEVLQAAWFDPNAETAQDSKSPKEGASKR
jgi:tetratricopeptide (TPR) repeat protein